MGSPGVIDGARTGLPWFGISGLSPGAIELAKWVAMSFMVVDHVNKCLYFGKFEYAYDIGRLALPFFATVLGLNLAGLRDQDLARITKKLIVFGVLAVPAWIAMGILIPMWLFRILSPIGIHEYFNYWWPLNILFSFAAAVTIVRLLNYGTPLHVAMSIVVFIVCGAFVEFYWSSIAICVAGWLMAKKPGIWPFLCWFLAIASLFYVNGNHWALASIPVIIIILSLDIKLPRIKHFFYWFYPVHLWAILAVRLTVL